MTYTAGRKKKSDLDVVLEHAGKIAEELRMPWRERSAFIDSIRQMARSFQAVETWQDTKPEAVNGAE